MKGGTATISNLGTSREQFFTPILNSGQMVLLGIGAITPRLALDEKGELIERKMMGLSLTVDHRRSEEHTSELQSLMRISYAVFCLKKKITMQKDDQDTH